MAIDFELTRRQSEMVQGIQYLADKIIRPQSLAWDRAGRIPDEFLANLHALIAQRSASDRKSASSTGKRQANLDLVLAIEPMAYGDASLPLTMPGPGLGGPPVKSSGTAEQQQRFLAMFNDMSEGPRWGAYALTEPGAGSDAGGIRTSCRRDGAFWILDGRKCYITNGARASWTVVFATIDPALGKRGHRAFVVEKGTPGFSVGRIEDKMGLRASETAELVFDACRVPADNLLGGEESYVDRGAFVTAMKTFDNTRPLVAAMACGIGRAAYEHACAFLKENYVLGRPIARYAALAERLAGVGRRLAAARMATWRAAWMADEKATNAKEASMAKALAGQAAVHACIQAIEICGAEGTIAHDGSLLEKWYRDSKVFDIFEGTGQIQRIVIAKRLLAGVSSF